jgi:RNA polymerase sigma factor (sigma-70 family)
MSITGKYSDAELIEALKSKNDIDNAIKFIYQKLFNLLKIYIVNNSGTEIDAEDTFQEVIIAFIKLVHENKFRGESSIQTFLYVMNRNIWLTELKKRNKKLKRENIYESQKENVQLNTEQLIVQVEMQKQILQIVSTLGETCKKILIAFYYENLSMKEILANTEYATEQTLRNKKYKRIVRYFRKKSNFVKSI